MKKFIYTCVITLVIMFISSCIDTPRIESIRFIDDRTIEYENEFSLGVGWEEGRGHNGYDVKLLSLTPDNGARRASSWHTPTKGRLYLTKDIPDGTVVKLEFYYADTDDFAFTYTVVKGE